MEFVFVTDLDGTLLGQETFEFNLIKPEVISLLDNGHLFVVASSKTKAEIEKFCNELGRQVPFIYENGAGIENLHLVGGRGDIPLMHQNVRAIKTDTILRIWEWHIPCDLRNCCHFVKDMDKRGQQACLGLRGKDLDRALKRSFSLPFIFSGSDPQRQRLEHLSTRAGLSIQMGGRVHNLSGCHDKVDYLPEIRRLATQTKIAPVLIVLGDSKNDIKMLKSADVSCVIPHQNGSYLRLEKSPLSTIIAPRAAPFGWLDAVEEAQALFSVKDGVTYG